MYSSLPSVKANIHSLKGTPHQIQNVTPIPEKYNDHNLAIYDNKKYILTYNPIDSQYYLDNLYGDTDSLNLKEEQKSLTRNSNVSKRYVTWIDASSPDDDLNRIYYFETDTIQEAINAVNMLNVSFSKEQCKNYVYCITIQEKDLTSKWYHRLLRSDNGEHFYYDYTPLQKNPQLVDSYGLPHISEMPLEKFRPVNPSTV